MASKTIKATVNPKKRGSTTALIVLYTALALFSIFMGFFDIANGRRVFGTLFFIAAIIFIILLLIKGNTVFGTLLKIKHNALHLKSWDNGFLPYNPDGGIFSDLKPSKTKMISVPTGDIETILIGTKDFIKRNMTNSGKRFLKALYPYEHSSKKSKRNSLNGLDIFYLETSDSCAFMCIQDFSVKNVVSIINDIYCANPTVNIKVSNREYMLHIKKLQQED